MRRLLTPFRTAHKRGHEAAMKGTTFDKCPYTRWNWILYILWQEGWQSGMHEKLEEFNRN